MTACGHETKYPIHVTRKGERITMCAACLAAEKPEPRPPEERWPA